MTKYVSFLLLLFISLIEHFISICYVFVFF